MSYIDQLAVCDVIDADTFAEFARQTIGVPLYRRDVCVLKGAAREFFELNPNADWKTLARTAVWCWSKSVRPRSVVGVVEMVRHAWEDGALPELDDNRDQRLETDIAHALTLESDPWWRRVLIASSGEARLRNYRRWRDEREHLYRKASA